MKHEETLHTPSMLLRQFNFTVHSKFGAVEKWIKKDTPSNVYK